MAWRFYIVVRSICLWSILAIASILLCSTYVVVAAFAPEGRAVRAIERIWVWFILRGSRVRLTARGFDHVVSGQSYVVMANHRSLYDIPALHYLLGHDRDLRWVGKRELVAVPFFGWAFGLSRHIAIDRENRERAVAALKRAAAESVEGVSFSIMPEGTRNTGRGLLPFKKGGFHLAIDTGLPILPVAVHGSDRLLRKGSWRILPGAIDVEVLPPLRVEGLDKDDLEPLMERTRARLEAALANGVTASAGRSSP